MTESIPDRAAFASRLVEAGCHKDQARWISQGIYFAGGLGEELTKAALGALRVVLNDSEKPERQTVTDINDTAFFCDDEVLTMYLGDTVVKMPVSVAREFAALIPFAMGEGVKLQSESPSGEPSAVSAPPASASSDAPANADDEINDRDHAEETLARVAAAIGLECEWSSSHYHGDCIIDAFEATDQMRAELAAQLASRSVSEGAPSSEEDAELEAVADKACRDRDRDHGGIYGHEQTLIRFGVIRGFRAGQARQRPEITTLMCAAFSEACLQGNHGSEGADVRAGLEAMLDILYGERNAASEGGNE